MRNSGEYNWINFFPRGSTIVQPLKPDPVITPELVGRATRFLISFSHYFFRFWAVRKIKLAIPSAFERTLISTVSYQEVPVKALKGTQKYGRQPETITHTVDIILSSSINSLTQQML